jgi:hypothetical protein
MIEIDAKISLSKEQIEKILDEYIQKNTKFTPVSFKFNLEKSYSGGFGGYSEGYYFDSLDIKVKLKD